jgi:superfamily II DNA/RNA helicase
VLGKARTGSGKTLGFGLPAIARLAEAGRPEPHKPRAVVLVPTRELAMQVNDALEPYAHAMHVSLRLVAGGLSMSKQVYALQRGVHLLVATPGRLADLVRRGDADMSDVSLVVLDEADHMADMGFMDEITEILASVPAGGQRLLFSATLDGDVDRLVTDYMSDPVLHDVTDGDDAPAAMTHVGLNVPPHLKYQIANRIVSREGRTIVFVRTKLGCDRIAGQMREAGINAVALHGDKTQAERNNAISGFRAGTIPVLVATDVAARGIHVDSVDLVMQIDPPADHKDYTHRAGRTARAGEAGMVVTLVLPHQRKTVDRLFENAGVEPLFRKIRGDDAESMAMVDQLTGGHEPSGIPVPEPRVPRSATGRGRPERGRSDRGRPERGGSRGHGDANRRPSRGMSDGGRWDSRREDAGAARARDDIARKERELADRERQLALREQELNSRATQDRPSKPAASRERYERDDRPSRGSSDRGGRPQRSGSSSYDRSARPARSDRSDLSDRGSRPQRSGSSSYDRSERPQRGRDGAKPAWKRDDSATGRSSGARSERDKRSGADNSYDRKPKERQRGDGPDGSAPRKGGPRRPGTPGGAPASRKRSSSSKQGPDATPGKAKKPPKSSNRSGKPRPKKK